MITLDDVATARKVMNKRAEEYKQGMATWAEFSQAIIEFNTLFDMWLEVQ